MKIRPRQHAPTGRPRISIGLTIGEATALAACLRRSMLVDQRDPDGLDSFAHHTLEELERALRETDAAHNPSE